MTLSKTPLLTGLALSLSLSLSLSATGVCAQDLKVWLTTGDQTHLLEAQTPLKPQRAAKGTAEVVVDATRTHQSMVGFGASITDSSAWLITTKLSAPARQALLEELYGTQDGQMGLSFARLTIGGSDFSRHHYSFDDVPKGETDPELKRFSIDPNRSDVLPVVRAALKINPQLKVMATPWSAPAWMKTTDSLIKGRLRPDAYPAFARYFVRYIRAYEAEGVPVFAITIQNEPHFEPENYPGMRVEPAERAAFIGGHLGPLLAAEGLKTQIFDWDHNWDQPESPMAVLADPVASRYVSAVAWHCYAGDVSAQAKVLAAYPDKDVYFTECSGGQWAPEFAGSFAWFMKNLIIGSVNGGAKGVLLWNLALDEAYGPHAGGCGDCRGVVTIDSATGEVTRNLEYYALGHASRFVKPGAVRLQTQTSDGLHSVAFRNPDGSRAVIVLNDTPSPTRFALRGLGNTPHAAYVYSLPPGAAATFVLPDRKKP